MANMDALFCGWLPITPRNIYHYTSVLDHFAHTSLDGKIPESTFPANMLCEWDLNLFYTVMHLNIGVMIWNALCAVLVQQSSPDGHQKPYKALSGTVTIDVCSSLVYTYSYIYQLEAHECRIILLAGAWCRGESYEHVYLLLAGISQFRRKFIWPIYFDRAASAQRTIPFDYFANNWIKDQTSIFTLECMSWIFEQICVVDQSYRFLNIKSISSERKRELLRQENNRPYQN